MPAALAAVVASAITAGVLWTMRPPITPAVIARFPLVLDATQTFTNLGRPAIAVSPDGQRLAYIANFQVWVRPLSELNASPIKATFQGAGNPANLTFSPDGRSIAYWQVGQIKTIEIAGGAPVTVCATENPSGMSWSGDSLLFGTIKGVMRVPASGGEPEVVVPIETQEVAFRPQMLPGAKAVLFTLAGREHATVGEGQGRGAVARQRCAHHAGRGRERCAIRGERSPRLRRLRSSVRACRSMRRGWPSPAGRFPSSRAFAAAAATWGAARPSSACPTAALSPILQARRRRRASADLRIGLFDKSGVTEMLNVPPGPYSEPRMSPDGRAIAFGRNDGRDRQHLGLRDVGCGIGAAADVWRPGSIPGVDGRQPPGGVPVGSRRRPGALLAKRRRHRHGGAADQTRDRRRARRAVGVAGWRGAAGRSCRPMARRR